MFENAVVKIVGKGSGGSWVQGISSLGCEMFQESQASKPMDSKT